MDGYFFKLHCSLVTSVTPAAEFRFDFSGSSNPPIVDYITTNISDTEQSVTVELNGSFRFPEKGDIQVKCIVSNPNGNDSATTSVRLCGKGTL